MSLIYSKDDEKDLRRLNDMDDYEEDNEGEEGEEDSQEDSQQSGIGMPGKGKGLGFGKVLGKAGKVIKAVGKVISMLPLPLKIAVIVFIAGFVTALILEINKLAATDETTTPVGKSIYDMNQQAQTGQVTKADGTVVTLTEEERQKVQKAVEFYKENNSYLYFKLFSLLS